MANVTVYNMEGKEVGTMELNDAVFGAKVNEHLVHMAVVQYLANKRQGTQKAKTRSEVSGGGRKPWRQKGTGHARQGSTRSPQWTGGGMVFAPVPRDYSFKINKKEKRAAMRSVLTDKVQNNKLIVLEDLKLDAIKTKDFVKVLDNLKVGKALVVTGAQDMNVILSARNLPLVETSYVTVEETEGKREIKSNINVYDVMRYDTLVATKSAIANIEEVYA
jgi:large subunit ribosomal protein L4